MMPSQKSVICKYLNIWLYFAEFPSLREIEDRHDENFPWCKKCSLWLGYSDGKYENN